MAHVPRRATPRPHAWWAVVLLAVLPWTWFLVRDLWPPLDGIATALPAVAAVALVATAAIGLRIREPAAVVVGLSILAAAIVAMLGPRVPNSTAFPASPTRIAAANVSDRNRTPEQAARILATRDADLVIGVEMPPGFWERWEALDDHLYGESQGELGVRSSWPVERLGGQPVVPGARLMRLRIDRPGAPFILYAVHAANPLTTGDFEAQRRFSDQLVSSAEREPLPVVIAGDLNLSDRAEGYRTLTSVFLDATRSGAGAWPGDTYLNGWWHLALLRIDHLLAPQKWCAATSGRFVVPGSDHRGVAATVGPCPPR
jgi:endonuclease/exonuclease/phosphatase (EEP) superfamily protein YafD